MDAHPPAHPCACLLPPGAGGARRPSCGLQRHPGRCAEARSQPGAARGTPELLTQGGKLYSSSQRGSRRVSESGRVVAGVEGAQRCPARPMPGWLHPGTCPFLLCCLDLLQDGPMCEMLWNDPQDQLGMVPNKVRGIRAGLAWRVHACCPGVLCTFHPGRPGSAPCPDLLALRPAPPSTLRAPPPPSPRCAQRGVGVAFGPDVAKRWLESQGLQMVVRSHEVRGAGSRWAGRGRRGVVRVGRSATAVHSSVVHTAGAASLVPPLPPPLSSHTHHPTPGPPPAPLTGQGRGL